MSSQDQFKERMEQLGQGFDASTQGIGERWGDETQALYASRGIGAAVGMGQNPAVLVIDMAIAFNDPSYKVGGDQTPAVEAIAELLPVAREKQVPVIFFTTAYDPEGKEAGVFGKKIPALLELQLGDRGVEIDPRLEPRAGEIVITKKYASAFFQTNLPSLLVTQGIDTVILTGCSTSGCVRAASIDGVSHGYRVILPLECVSDRAEGPHWANLFDINAKYGDVLPLADVIEQLRALPDDPAERRIAAAAAR
ncbi:MAG: isochorismatase family protein [Thermoleophilia bacterium]